MEIGSDFSRGVGENAMEDLVEIATEVKALVEKWDTDGLDDTSLALLDRYLETLSEEVSTALLMRKQDAAWNEKSA